MHVVVGRRAPDHNRYPAPPSLGGDVLLYIFWYSSFFLPISYFAEWVLCFYIACGKMSGGTLK